MNKAKILTIKLKNNLSVEEHQRIKDLLCTLPYEEREDGVVKCWDSYTHGRGLFAFFAPGIHDAIGLAESSGCPVSGAGWWIAPAFRKQGYGYALVDALAHQRLSDGVKSIQKKIPILTVGNKYNEYSKKLMSRFRSYFTQAEHETTD